VAFPARTAAASKSWMLLLKPRLDFPEELLSHVGVADFVGMGKAVAARRGACAQGDQKAAVVPKGVADVIQADRIGRLGIHEQNHMAGGAECPGLFVNSMFFGKASVNPGKQEILFEQRNARKDTKKFHGSGFFCENKPYFP